MSESHIKATEPRKTLRGSGQLRSACDPCHHSKVRCSGGNPCVSCTVAQTPCTYSVGSRLGRPKGSKNKRTLAIQERQNSSCSNTPGTSGASVESGVQGFLQLSGRRPYGSHERGLSDALLSPLAAPYVHNTAQCDNVTLLGNLSDSLFGDEWSSWVPTIDGGLGLDGGLQRELNLQFCMSPNGVPCDDEGDAWGISVGSTQSERTSLGIQGPTGTPQYSWTLSQDALLDQNTSRSLGGPECDCRQQLVRLVYRLEDLRYSHISGSSIDCVLNGVRDAQGPWKTVMQCTQCRNNCDEEVLLLFSMSIRTLLSSVYSLCAGHFHAVRSLQVAASSPSTSTTPPSSSASTSSVLDRQASPGEHDMRVSVGSYELTEEEKYLTLGLMIRIALRAIAVAFLHLCERTSTSTPGPNCQQDASCSSCSSAGGASKASLIELLERLRQNPLELGHLNVDDVGSLLHNLRGTMEVLKTTTNKSNRQNQNQIPDNMDLNCISK